MESVRSKPPETSLRDLVETAIEATDDLFALRSNAI